ncbi:unnamed protein product [Polarella glacialis]|uniref:RING-type domain-containing protein n=1 Tax=Polarella glacialis TaxID=89957 RepID=A0A813JQQ0_POLGL|nr:unnamed protein product [Polarella glacialis]CAE8682795.1 unnamed protein product [Polarella glacialis]
MSSSNQGKPWSYDQTKELLGLFASGKLCSNIALHFGRTTSAIQARLCRLYFGECADKEGPATKQMKRWSTQDDLILLEKYKNGARIQDLMRHLGRSPKSIELRLLENAPRSLLRYHSERELHEMTKTHGEKTGLPANFKARWTTDEEIRIDKLYRVLGLSFVEIAEVVERTVVAVSSRLARIYFGADGSAHPAPWSKEDDSALLKAHGTSKDLCTTAKEISRQPNHVAFRLLELIPRPRLTRLSTADVQYISAKAVEMKSSGVKRIHSDLDHDGDAALCVICMSSRKDMALIPCGHTFCQQCVHRADMKTCAICRQPVASTLRLHN